MQLYRVIVRMFINYFQYYRLAVLREKRLQTVSCLLLIIANGMQLS